MFSNQSLSELSVFTREKKEIFLFKDLTSEEIKNLPKKFYNFLAKVNGKKRLDAGKYYRMFRPRRGKNGKIYIEYCDTDEYKIHQMTYYEKFMYDYWDENAEREKKKTCIPYISCHFLTKNVNIMEK